LEEKHLIHRSIRPVPSGYRDEGLTASIVREEWLSSKIYFHQRVVMHTNDSKRTRQYKLGDWLVSKFEVIFRSGDSESVKHRLTLRLIKSLSII
jgi:hypothetical protein